MRVVRLSSGRPSVGWLLLASGLLVGSGQVQALAGDRQQQIELEADRAELDKSKGVSIYTGNVRVAQGSLLLTGDRVTVYLTEGKPDRLVAEGQPARFKQRPDGKPNDVVATARQLEHMMNQDVLKLTGNAVVVQAGDRFSGDEMSYDMARDRVTAHTAKGSKSRVKMIIQPRKQADPASKNAP